MTKTLAELEQIATDCMESENPTVANRHHRAALEARKLAAATHPSERRFQRSREYAELIMAVELQTPAGDDLTTAELLTVAAMIAARANGEPFKLELEGPTRVLVALEGGLVQGAVADRPGVSVITVDYDTEGAPLADVLAIPQDNGGTAEGTLGGVSCSYDPDFIDRAEAAELADPEGAAAELERLEERRRGDAAFEAERLARIAAEAAELTDTHGDPLRELAPYSSAEQLERYDAGELNDEQTITELERAGWTERRARVILEEHQNA